jgi:hypothetical protein
VIGRLFLCRTDSTRRAAALAKEDHLVDLNASPAERTIQSRWPFDDSTRNSRLTKNCVNLHNLRMLASRSLL